MRLSLSHFIMDSKPVMAATRQNNFKNPRRNTRNKYKLPKRNLSGHVLLLFLSASRRQEGQLHLLLGVSHPCYRLQRRNPAGLPHAPPITPPTRAFRSPA